MRRNGLTCQMSGNVWNCSKLLELRGKALKPLEMAEMYGNCWKLLKEI